MKTGQSRDMTLSSHMTMINMHSVACNMRASKVIGVSAIVVKYLLMTSLNRVYSKSSRSEFYSNYQKLSENARLAKHSFAIFCNVCYIQ